MSIPAVYNLIIAITGPDGNQAIANLTVPDPGGSRFFSHVAGIGHMSNSEAIKVALKTGVNEIDTVTINPPTPPIEGAGAVPAEGEPLTQVYHNDLIDIAEGRKIVTLYDGDPLILTVEDAAAIDAGGKHIYRDLETGVVEVRDGDGKPVDLDPLASGSGSPDPGADQAGPTSEASRYGDPTQG